MFGRSMFDRRLTGRGLMSRGSYAFGAGTGVSQAAIVAAIVLAANGALYDPSDLTSLYQSRTGGSTGAMGQPVGIMLDKSYMGGRTAAAYIAGQAELVVNGDFATDTAWTKTTGWTISGGKANFVDSGAFRTLTQAFTFVASRFYRVTFDVSNYTSGILRMWIGTAALVNNFFDASANGSYTAIVQFPSGDTQQLVFRSNGASGLFNGSLDNVSVKEIPGFHAVANSDAARPLLTVSGGLAYLTADGVDDWMKVTPTLNLGEVWWHVGGWRSDTNLRADFGVSSNASSRAAAFRSSSTVRWANSGGTLTTVANGDPAAIHVLTLQQTSTSNMDGRFNGGTVTSITPFDDSADTQGLVLFSDRNTAWTNGLAGRFYGGPFCPGTISTTDRATLESYVAALAGVTL